MSPRSLPRSLPCPESRAAGPDRTRPDYRGRRLDRAQRAATPRSTGRRTARARAAGRPPTRWWCPARRAGGGSGASVQSRVATASARSSPAAAGRLEVGQEQVPHPPHEPVVLVELVDLGGGDALDEEGQHRRRPHRAHDRHDHLDDPVGERAAVVVEDRPQRRRRQPTAWSSSTATSTWSRVPSWRYTVMRVTPACSAMASIDTSRPSRESTSAAASSTRRRVEGVAPWRRPPSASVAGRLVGAARLAPQRRAGRLRVGGLDVGEHGQHQLRGRRAAERRRCRSRRRRCSACRRSRPGGRRRGR